MLTHSEKRDRLRNLHREVPDFHNWLQIVLPTLPHVRHVEYTHGRDEFGADFVVELENPTTNRHEFIGVIAKLGTIKQDTAEVERQIRECGIPRILRNGRDEQSLRVIWVVSNEGVSGNAKRKILHNFKSNAVDFFSADDVINWTDAHCSHLWSDLPSDISHYLALVRERNEATDKASRILDDQYSDLSIEVDVVPLEFDGDTFSLHKDAKPVSLAREVEQRRYVFIEGEMGAGKSQLLRDLTKTLSSPKAFAESEIFPVFTSYRDLVDQYEGSLKRLIEAELSPFISALEEHKAQVAVIVDGLDELPNADSQQSDPLKSLVTEARSLGYARVVATCRPDVVPAATLRSSPDLRYLQVKPLSTKKIVTFVRAVCERANLVSRVPRDLGKSDLFHQLPQNPIAALLLSMLMLKSTARSELPQTLTELYEKALELMLGRWDQDKGLMNQQQYEVSRKLCGELGRLIVENQLPSVGMGEIREHLSSYIRERNLTIDSAAVLEHLFSRSGVMIRSSEHTANFKHRSFAEFFCAQEWRHVGDFPVDNRALTPYWMTTYFFAIGQRSDCEPMLQALLGLVPQNEMERWGKFITSASYLLAGHMTPYRVVEAALPGIFVSAAQLYKDIVDRKIVSEAARIPPLKLFVFLALVIRDRYGYQFFQRSIDGTALAIDEYPNVELDVKQRALFFVGLAGLEVGDASALKYLARNYDPKDLPLEVTAMLGRVLKHEEFGNVPRLLRAYGKQIAKMFKNSPALAIAVRNMVDRPTSSIASKSVGKSKR